MSTLEVRLLGGLDVRADGGPLPPIPRAGRWLLSYLLLHRRRPVQREVAAELFWPELDPARARRRLSHTLWQIQDTLSEHRAAAGWLVTTPTTLGLEPDRAWLDVDEFERRLDQLRPASGEVPDWRRADLADLAAAVELYRGDLLPDVYEPWATVERERLARLHLDALGWAVDMCKSQGAFEEALQYARRVTHLDPLREDAHREVMRLHTLLGRPADALRQYDRLDSVLREELGNPPSAASRRLRDFVEQQASAPAPSSAPTSDAPAVSLRLVGRERERRVAVAGLERSLGGDPSVVLLEGEPGIGKTRLVQEMVDAAGWRGFHVLDGSAGAGTSRPYGIVRSALRAELSPVRVAQLRPLVDPVWLQAAARVLPELDRAGTAPPLHRLDPGDQAARTREGLARTVLALARLEPMLLVIEDLHDADPESLAVVDRLVRGLDRQQLAVVISYRSAEAREREDVWRALRLIDEVVAPDRIDLAPLSTLAVAELTRAWLGGSAPPTGLSPALHRETGGNPLFALETLAALRHGGHLDDGDLEAVPVSGGVRAVLEARMADLTAGTRSVLWSAALAGRADVDLLLRAQAAERPVGEIARHVAELVARGLLLETDAGLQFRHEVLRRVVEDTIPVAQAPELHGGLAAALRELAPQEHGRIARHLDAAGDAAGAFDEHHAAGRAAADVHAYATASQHLARARELATTIDVGPGALRDLLLDLEAALDVLGRRDEQRQVLDALDGIASVEDAGRIARRRAWFAWSTDDLSTAAELGRRARALATDAQDAIDAATVVGRALQAAGDLDGAARELSAALGDVDAGADPSAEVALGRLQLALGSVLAAASRYDVAGQHLQAATEVAARAGDPRTTADALSALGLVRAERGDRIGAVAHYRRALQVCRDVGYRYGEAVVRVNLGLASWDRPADALEQLEIARGAFRELGNDRGAAIAGVNLAFVRHLDLGDDDRARADAASAAAFFRRVGDTAKAAICAAVDAAIAIRLGDVRRATQLVEDTPDPADPWAAVELGSVRARLASVLGDVDAAIEVSSCAADIARSHGSWAQLASVLEVLVPALVDRGRAAEAVGMTTRLLEEAEEEGREIERPYRLWWAHHLAATAAGDATEATAALRTAAGTLEQLLVGLPADLADRARRDVPVHRDILAAAASLTSARTLTLRVARQDAPTGRPLEPHELIDVAVLLGSDPAEGREARREAIATVVEEVEAAGGRCTVDDLAQALHASTSTIRRDLRDLRGAGAELPTRGQRTH